MGRFDTAFSLAALVLIGVSVVCLCKTAEYRSQAKFATERYEEMKDSLTKAEREVERKLRETDAEWKAKIWKTEREAELAEKEQNRKHRLEIEKTRTEHAAEIAGRDEQIRALEERLVKLSNDADLPCQNGMRFYSYPTGVVACILKDRFDGLLHIRTYKSLDYLKTYGVNALTFDVPCLSEDWELAEYLKFEFRLKPEETSVMLAGLYLYEAMRSAAKSAFKSEFSV